MPAWITLIVMPYALPCLMRQIAARVAFDTGAGWIGAFSVFGLTAIVEFRLMGWLVAALAHPKVRIFAGHPLLGTSGREHFKDSPVRLSAIAARRAIADFRKCPEPDPDSKS